MKLADQWRGLEGGLPDTWESLRLTLTTESASDLDRAAQVLGSLGAGRVGDALVVTVSRSGQGGAGPEAVRRLFSRLDDDRVWATITPAAPPSEQEPAEPARRSVAAAASWDTALSTLPSDWSDALFELRIGSSALLPRAALLCAPLNPTRDRDLSGFVFRGSGGAGYGASTGMVRRCLERLDEEDIEASVTVRRALSGSALVGTQGPSWLVDGRVL
ncbi:MAG: hypothetical protein ACKVUT_04090 [Gaiella sp.]